MRVLLGGSRRVRRDGCFVIPRAPRPCSALGGGSWWLRWSGDGRRCRGGTCRVRWAGERSAPVRRGEVRQGYAVATRPGVFDRDLVDVLVTVVLGRMVWGPLGGLRGVAPRGRAVLAGPAAWPFVRDELAVIEDLAAPHA